MRRASLNVVIGPLYSFNVAQTKIGAMKTAAKKVGVPFSTYIGKVNAGLKFCYAARHWTLRQNFQKDSSRGDGLASACKACRSNHLTDTSASSIPDETELIPSLTRSEIVRKGWIKRQTTFVPPMKGKRMSLASRQKMSAAAKARPSNRIGKRHTVETRTLISQRTRERTPKGPSCHSFKDGKFLERRGERFSIRYKQWRYDVFSRDRFACQGCGDAKGGNLHAHHIKSFSDFPSLRYEISNGITLCERCHKREHTKRLS